ncbi:MAG: radical SAM protein [Archangiaceae bacterium]|nr:radical SAM protein [Archangiaceae bacterium]
MKRLRLVQLPVPPPAALAATGNVPLAAGALAASAQFHGLTSRLEVEVVPPDVTDAYGDAQLADHIARDEPDFLGLSLYLWNVERSLHLAREVKRRSPHTQVLIGGPEVSLDNPFVLGQQGFDVAVSGEAEESFGSVMRALLDGAQVPRVVVSPTATFPLDRYPSPYSFVPVDPRRSTYVETVRGCRSSCTFCFYPKSSGALRVLGVEESARMIAGLRERGAREVVFLDPTFNHRPDFEALVDALADVNHDHALTFFAEVRAEGLTAQHARQLKRAGFDKLELGLQSVNRLTLKRVKRGGSPEKVAAAAQLLHGEGISLLVDLIVGLPGDTADDVRRGVDFLHQHQLGDEAQVFALSLLPGTAMRTTAAADGVVFDAAPPYRVTRTATLETEQLSSLLDEAEAQLDRRLDEVPRPHLVDGGDAPGARHSALWARGPDLFAQRAELAAQIDARVAKDPYCTLDVVLEAQRDFPLDLVDAVRARLDAAPPSYLSRALKLRGEDLQRRISVVVPESAKTAPGWVEAARAVVPVFVEQRAADAVAHAAELGDARPAARIVGPVSAEQLERLGGACEVEAVAFADASLESRWVRRALD